MTDEVPAGGVKIPVIVGPTAIGKTDLAMHLCEKFDMELLSCDSRQIYRFMDIGTAKPTAQQQQRVKHWMVDIVRPDQQYSCHQFVEDSLEIIRRRASEGKKMLLCGGSGLYFNSLSNGIGTTTPPNKQLRDSYYEKARTEGNEAVYRELLSVDPVTAGRSHPSNLQRNIRALEVFHSAHIPLSELKKNSTPPAGVDFLACVCTMPRNELYLRINRRVDSMMSNGLAEEFFALRAKGYNEQSPGMQCVGYKELFDVERRNITLKDATEAIKMNSRHYAKRQITWFKHQLSGIELSMENPNLALVERMIEQYLFDDTIHPREFLR